MALPLTGITTSEVAAAIGEGSNDVGTLFLSGKVNPWGFNCPDLALQNAIWGKLSYEREKLSPNSINYTPITGVKPGYHLGAFRGYDHMWVAYVFDEITTDFNHGNDLYFRLYIAKPSVILNKPDPVPAVEHEFKIEFARNSADFDNGTATVLWPSFVMTYPYRQFLINSKTPPDYDVNGSLVTNETFYIKVTHLNSPERRWADVTSIMNSYVTPTVLNCTETMEFRNLSIIAVKGNYIAQSNFTVSADIYADYSQDKIIDVIAYMSTTSDYSLHTYSMTENDIAIAPNTTNPGTKVFVKNVSFNFTSSGIFPYAMVGGNVYGKISLADGTHVLSGSKVVTEPLQG